VHRQEIDTPYGPQVVDFFRMTPAARQRFVACTKRRTTPSPILADRVDAPGTYRLWVALALFALGGMIGLGALGFGELTPGRTPQPSGFLAADAALGVVAVFALFSALRIGWVRGKLPYGPGVYVFPVDLVDATTSHLGLVPLSELKDAKVEAGPDGKQQAVLSFADGAAFAFPIRKGEEAAIEELGQMREGVKRAVESNHLQMLEQLDVFFEERIGDGWKALRPEGTSTKRRRRIPALAVLVPLLGVVFGALFGRAFWLHRNDANDRAGLEAAVAAGDYNLIASYADFGGRLAEEADRAQLTVATRDAAHPVESLVHYLHHGRYHLDEADDDLFLVSKTIGTLAAWKDYLDVGRRHLEEADDGLFEAAKKEGTPEAFDFYLKVGPQKRHEDEVRKKLLPLAQLELAKRAASMAPLRKFLADHAADPEIAAAAHAAVHVRFERARAKFGARFGVGTKEAELFGRVLDHVEERGQAIEVRLTQFPSKDLGGADDELVLGHPGRAVRSLPFFSAPRDSTRENSIAHELRMVVGDVFEGDVVEVEAGGDGAATAGADGPPRIEVRCEYVPDHHFVYDIGQRVFLAVGASCSGALVLPEDDTPSPLRFHLKFAPDRLRFDGTTVGENVYEGMLDPLAAELGERFRAALGGSAPPVR
jgi:hypothetical protein